MKGEDRTRITVPLYNPDLLDREALAAVFVARRELLDRLLEALRTDAGAGSRQHHLLIGARGMGKTTLLHRLRYAIEEDEELADAWLPLVFPEEQYDVARLSDFWKNCIDAVSDVLELAGRPGDAAAVDEVVRDLEAWGVRPDAGRTLALLLGIADRLDRSLVLLVDNVDLVFDRVHEEHWALRDALSEHPHLLLIGASHRMMESTYDYGGSFYDFFRLHELRGLSLEDTRAVLLRLADISGTPQVRRAVEDDEARIRALHVLTGGNPRATVLLFNILAQRPEGDVRRNLEHLLDQVTPVYKARIEEMAPQAQLVLHTLAIHWDPMTAADLAKVAGLKTSTASAQLTRLAADGVVQKAPYFEPSSKVAYQVAERIFNIWYLMRASRRVRRRLVFLVEFLRLFYTASELRRRARDFTTRSMPRHPKGRIRYAEYGLVLARAIDLGPLSYAVETRCLRTIAGDEGLRGRLGELFDLAGHDSDLAPRAEHERLLAEARDLVLATQPDGAVWAQARAWELLGGSPSLSVSQKARIAEGLDRATAGQVETLMRQLEAERRELGERLGPESARKLRECLRDGHLRSLDDVDGARAWEAMHGVPSLVALTISAHLSRSHSCHADGGSDAADLPALRKALDTATGPHPALTYLEIVAKDGEDAARLSDVWSMAVDRFRATFTAAHWNRAGNLLSGHLGRFNEAEQAYRRAIELTPDSALPWNGLGNLLAQHLGRFEGAEGAYRTAIALDSGYAQPWNGLGNVLLDPLGRFEEAEQAYRRAIALDSGTALPWHGLGNVLQECPERLDEAEWAYRRAIELDPCFVPPWNGLGNLLAQHPGRLDEAEQAYRGAIELDRGRALPWNGLGNLLAQQPGRFDEAERAYREAIELDPGYAHPWNSLGGLLAPHLGRLDEAERAFREALELDPSSTVPWCGLGDLFARHLGRFEEAERAYREAIELDPGSALPWSGLGDLLRDHFGQFDAAEAAHRRALELAADDPSLWNSLAWHLYLVRGDAAEAEALARAAWERCPEDLYVAHTLACILAWRDDWAGASGLARRFLGRGSPELHETIWDDIVEFFRASAAAGRAREAGQLLDELTLGQRWQPLREALATVAAGTREYLRRVAPEVRGPALGILKRLDPDGEVKPDPRAG